MLYGRDAPCARVERLLARARAGRSGALVVWGDPGIGKTALCRYAIEHAGGMVVLKARGVESESRLAFAGLSELLRPVLHHLDAIPAFQAAALAGVLGLAAPSGAPALTVFAATLSLLSAAAERAPVLAVVDDAHWIDGSSLQAVLFAAKRMQAEGVALLLALRPGEDGGGLLQSDLSTLALKGLDNDACAALLNAHAPAAVAPGVADRLAAATAGNPLALLELAGQLDEAQLTGRAPLDESVRLERVQQLFGRRLRGLPMDTRRALLVVAAGGHDPAAVSAALGNLGFGVSALGLAEEAGIVQVDASGIEFRHPLVRSAVYHGAEAAARRAAHRALADALSGPSAASRRAWHLAEAAVAPDEAVAAALEAAAFDARERSARRGLARVRACGAADRPSRPADRAAGGSGSRRRTRGSHRSRAPAAHRGAALHQGSAPPGRHRGTARPGEDVAQVPAAGP